VCQLLAQPADNSIVIALAHRALSFVRRLVTRALTTLVS